MKNIVIPIDFSPYSNSAARTGAFLSRKTYSRLHLLHVVAGPENWDRMSVSDRQKNPEVETRMVENTMRLEKFAKDPMFEDINVATHVKTGIAHERIVSFSRTHKADLIIIGAHGTGESGAIFVGSTAQKVLRVASCPVLSVKLNFDPASVKNILFPSDFEENVTDALDIVSELAVAVHAGIDLTFINTPANFVDSGASEQRMLAIQPKKDGVEINRFVYNHYQKDNGIIQAAKERGAGLIAMVTHNRKGKPAYSFGITESVLFLSDVPVLSMIVKN